MKEEDNGWNYEDLDWKEGFVLKDWPGLKESFDEMAWMKQKIWLKRIFLVTREDGKGSLALKGNSMKEQFLPKRFTWNSKTLEMSIPNARCQPRMQDTKDTESPFHKTTTRY